MRPRPLSAPIILLQNPNPQMKTKKMPYLQIEREKREVSISLVGYVKNENGLKHKILGIGSYS